MHLSLWTRIEYILHAVEVGQDHAPCDLLRSDNTVIVNLVISSVRYNLVSGDRVETFHKVFSSVVLTSCKTLK